MKVRIILVADVDPQGYRDEYGTDESPTEMREYVRQSVLEAAREGMRPLGYVRQIDEVLA